MRRGRGQGQGVGVERRRDGVGRHLAGILGAVRQRLVVEVGEPHGAVPRPDEIRAGGPGIRGVDGLLRASRLGLMRHG